MQGRVSPPSCVAESTSLWKDEVLLDTEIDPALATVGDFLALGSAMSGCEYIYLLDGPDQGSVLFVDCQNAWEPIVLARSLEHYMTALVGVARRGFVQVTENGPPHHQIFPVWLDHEVPEVPADLQQELGIGPLFY